MKRSKICYAEERTKAAKRLQQLIDRSGRTATEIAEELSYHKSSISKILNGERTFDMLFLLEVLSLSGVQTNSDDLFDLIDCIELMKMLDISITPKSLLNLLLDSSKIIIED